MKTNALRKFRERLSRNEPVFGIWVTLESASITEMAVALGLDWVVIDAEHGHLDWKEINEHIRAAVRSDTVVLVRLAERSTALTKRVLDIGADGVVIPWIETAEQLREAVRVNPDVIEIVSYPGPDTSIRPADLNAKRIISRRYRNRRIGEFFKELEMTEGRGTGIPRIQAAMKRNGSPKARFKTDELRLWFLVELPIRKAFATGEAQVEAQELAQVGTKLALSRHQVEILEKCREETGITALMELAERKDRTKFRQQVLNPLLVAGLIEMTIPDKPRSSLQGYRTTAAGRSELGARKTKS